MAPVLTFTGVSDTGCGIASVNGTNGTVGYTAGNTTVTFTFNTLSTTSSTTGTVNIKDNLGNTTTYTLALTAAYTSSKTEAVSTSDVYSSTASATISSPNTITTNSTVYVNSTTLPLSFTVSSNVGIGTYSVDGGTTRQNYTSGSSVSLTAGFSYKVYLYDMFGTATDLYSITVTQDTASLVSLADAVSADPYSFYQSDSKNYYKSGTASLSATVPVKSYAWVTSGTETPASPKTPASPITAATSISLPDTGTEGSSNTYYLYTKDALGLETWKALTYKSVSSWVYDATGPVLSTTASTTATAGFYTPGILSSGGTVYYKTAGDMTLTLTAATDSAGTYGYAYAASPPSSYTTGSSLTCAVTGATKYLYAKDNVGNVTKSSAITETAATLKLGYVTGSSNVYSATSSAVISAVNAIGSGSTVYVNETALTLTFPLTANAGTASYAVDSGTSVSSSSTSIELSLDAGGSSAISHTVTFTDKVGNTESYSISIQQDTASLVSLADAVSADPYSFYQSDSKNYYKSGTASLSATVPVKSYAWVTSGTETPASPKTPASPITAATSISLPDTGTEGSSNTYYLYTKDALGLETWKALTYNSVSSWVYDGTAPDISSIAFSTSTAGFYVSGITTAGGTIYYKATGNMTLTVVPGSGAETGSGIYGYRIATSKSTASSDYTTAAAAASSGLPYTVPGTGKKIYVRDNVGNIGQTSSALTETQDTAGPDVGDNYTASSNVPGTDYYKGYDYQGYVTNYYKSGYTLSIPISDSLSGIEKYAFSTAETTSDTGTQPVSGWTAYSASPLSVTLPDDDLDIFQTHYWIWLVDNVGNVTSEKIGNPANTGENWWRVNSINAANFQYLLTSTTVDSTLMTTIIMQVPSSIAINKITLTGATTATVSSLYFGTTATNSNSNVSATDSTDALYSYAKYYYKPAYTLSGEVLSSTNAYIADAQYIKIYGSGLSAVTAISVTDGFGNTTALTKQTSSFSAMTMISTIIGPLVDSGLKNRMAAAGRFGEMMSRGRSSFGGSDAVNVVSRTVDAVFGTSADRGTASGQKNAANAAVGGLPVHSGQPADPVLSNGLNGRWSQAELRKTSALRGIAQLEKDADTVRAASKEGSSVSVQRASAATNASQTVSAQSASGTSSASDNPSSAADTDSGLAGTSAGALLKILAGVAVLALCGVLVFVRRKGKK
jgi:hypothetical protein